MSPKFGTSGLRGLVVELTPGLVAGHVRAFLAACDVGGVLFVGRDLRDSSPGLVRVAVEAALAAGCDVVDCGARLAAQLLIPATPRAGDDQAAARSVEGDLPQGRVLKLVASFGRQRDHAAAALGPAEACPSLPVMFCAGSERLARLKLGH